MSDLRQRVADATAEAFARYWEDPPPEFMSDVDDAALAVFADWLRERATAAGMQYRAEAELRALADEIAPKESDHG